MAARGTFPELVRLDAELAEHFRRMPSVLAPQADHLAWHQTMVAGRAERARILAEIDPLLCGNCGGTGLTSHRRANGLCFRCQGDGWSARGRRQAAKAGAR